MPDMVPVTVKLPACVAPVMGLITMIGPAPTAAVALAVTRGRDETLRLRRKPMCRTACDDGAGNDCRQRHSANGGVGTLPDSREDDRRPRRDPCGHALAFAANAGREHCCRELEALHGACGDRRER